MTRIVITGAASSIGAVTAAELMRRCADIVLPDRNADQDDVITSDVRTRDGLMRRWLTP